MPARSDQLFKKRRGLERSRISRRAADRVPDPRVLVVCEGTRTEVHYFESLRNKLGASALQIEVRADCGSAPVDVVNRAEELVRAEGGPSRGGFEAVYCVFDQDSHESYWRAIAKVEALARSRSFPVRRFHAITSVPCFEVWLISHFWFCRRPIVDEGGRSAGEVAVGLLRGAPGFEQYNKRLTEPMIVRLMDNIEIAIKNAEECLLDASKTASDNPTTKVHLPVSFLLEKYARRDG